MELVNFPRSCFEEEEEHLGCGGGHWDKEQTQPAGLPLAEVRLSGRRKGKRGHHHHERGHGDGCDERVVCDDRVVCGPAVPYYQQSAAAAADADPAAAAGADADHGADAGAGHTEG